MKRFLCLFTLLAAAAPAKVYVVFRLASPPLPVEAGQQFSLCAANVGTAKADLTLQFINVRTGAVVKTRDLMLPPPGGSGMPDPCLAASAEELGPPAGDPPLLVALVVIRHSIFGRAAAATASVQVTVPGGHIVASIPLHVATLVNGRNTPIEVR